MNQNYKDRLYGAIYIIGMIVTWILVVKYGMREHPVNNFPDKFFIAFMGLVCAMFWPISWFLFILSMMVGLL